MKKIASIILCSLIVFCGCGNTSGSPNSTAETPTVSDPSNSSSEEDIPNVPVFSQFAPPADGEEYVVITTELGTIELRLFPEYAPKAVENFKTHAKDGYYDGLIFHRVIKDFVIQTGDPLGTGYGGESIWEDGFSIEPNSAVRHFNGALGMARGSDPNSNGSQFYIVQNSKIQDSLAQELEYMKENQDEPIEEGYDMTVGELFPVQVIDNYLSLGGTPTLDYGYTVFGQVISGMDVVEAIAQAEVDDGDKPLKDIIMTKVEIKEYGK